MSFHERFDTDLTEFLDDYECSEYALMCIVFQVVYTLGALQCMLPGFRHNDLSTNNVFVKMVTKRAEQRLHACSEYSMHGRTFWVRMPYLFVALCDWDFAHATGGCRLQGLEGLRVRNERVLSGEYGVRSAGNDSYDTHYFLATLQRRLDGRHKEYPLAWAFPEAPPGQQAQARPRGCPRCGAAARPPAHGPLLCQPAEEAQGGCGVRDLQGALQQGTRRRGGRGRGGVPILLRRLVLDAVLPVVLRHRLRL